VFLNKNVKFKNTSLTACEGLIISVLKYLFNYGLRHHYFRRNDIADVFGMKRGALRAKKRRFQRLFNGNSMRWVGPTPITLDNFSFVILKVTGGRHRLSAGQ
jgi:hypothetical protein